MIAIERINTREDVAVIQQRQPLFMDDQAVQMIVDEIIRRIAEDGDKALVEYANRFDQTGISTASELRVSADEIEAAFSSMEKNFISAIERAKRNISEYHQQNLPKKWEMELDGIRVGRLVRPLKRVGAYVPGGRAAYPSTLLMTAIPAFTAGVSEVIVCCPPDESGRIDPHTLAAAKVAGVEEIYRVGGAQAIAAMAYGTDTISRVDKICGPGNIFVTIAKSKIISVCGIDMLAGPSEIVIIADDSAHPDFIACDMFAQAEHDPHASAILISLSQSLAEKTSAALVAELAKMSRRETIEKSLQANGRIFVVDDLDLACDLTDAIAPEHLELCITDWQHALERINNAGAIFIGSYSPESLGDYIAGPNHVLPTAGTARFSSPLSVEDFFKSTSLISAGREAFLAVAQDIKVIAEAEGLEAHARSAMIRSGKQDDGC